MQIMIYKYTHITIISLLLSPFVRGIYFEPLSPDHDITSGNLALTQVSQLADSVTRVTTRVTIQLLHLQSLQSL